MSEFTTMNLSGVMWFFMHGYPFFSLTFIIITQVVSSLEMCAATTVPPEVKVILLDLDGTIIGQIAPSVCEYDILRTLDAKQLPAFRRQLVARLRYGPVRPHFAAFMKQAKAMGLHVFVYTASEGTWASLVVTCIERALGVQFARPIFSRRSCIVDPGTGEYKKSIARVLPVVHRRLRTRAAADNNYREGLGFNLTLEGLRSSTVLVDNTATVLHDKAEAGCLVRCPTYAYTYVYDVLALLDVDVLHAKFHRLAPVLKRHGLLHASVDAQHLTFQQFMHAFHHNLASLLAATYRANQASLKHDSFFLGLLSAVARGSGRGTCAGRPVVQHAFG